MKKFLIVYHREDNDGVFSAAIAEAHIRGNFEGAEVTLLPSDYASLGKLSKDDVDKWVADYDKIIMTDISFSDPKMMAHLFEVAATRFTWIDHHAPAINASYKMSHGAALGERDTAHSAILLAYKYFYDPLGEQSSEGKIPEFLRILSAWDSFTYEREGYELDFVRNVNKGVTEHFRLNTNAAMNYFDMLLSGKVDEANDIEKFHALGKMLNEYDDRKMQDAIEYSGDFTWTVADHPAVAVFTQGHTNSVMFKPAEGRARHAAVFKRKSDGCWTMSLYNISNEDEFHCGEYLKAKYKGGGHVGAGGCTLTQPQFIRLLKSKCI